MCVASCQPIVFFLCFASLVPTYATYNNIYCLKKQFQEIWCLLETGNSAEAKGTWTWKPVAAATTLKDGGVVVYNIKVLQIFKLILKLNWKMKLGLIIYGDILEILLQTK